MTGRHGQVSVSVSVSVSASSLFCGLFPVGNMSAMRVPVLSHARYREASIHVLHSTMAYRKQTEV